MNFIDQITLPLFIVWAAGLLLAFFRKDLDFLWKAFFLVIFAFYIVHFYPELVNSFFRFKANYAKELVQWIYGIGKGTYYFLFIVWPLVLMRFYYTASQNFSEMVIKSLVIVTLCFWTGYFVYSFFEASIDNFLLNRLVNFLRF